MARKSFNEDLRPLPSEEEIIAAMRKIVAARRKSGWTSRGWDRMTAGAIARMAGVEAARQLGNGAKKGSWSGTQSPGSRLGPRLLAMARRGVIVPEYDREDYRWRYALVAEQDGVS